MLKTVGGVARTLYILLAVIAAFVAFGSFDVAMILLLLGIIAGLAMPEERFPIAAITLLILPLVGAAVANIPTVGEYLAKIAGNLQIGVAGALATALAVGFFRLAVDGVSGITGKDGSAAKK